MGKIDTAFTLRFFSLPFLGSEHFLTLLSVVYKNNEASLNDLCVKKLSEAFND